MKGRRKARKKAWEQYTRILRKLRAKWLTEQKNRDKAVKETPQNVRIREEAAARCTKVIKRRVLKKQARKARADHLVKCSLMPGRRQVEKKAVVGVVCVRSLYPL